MNEREYGVGTLAGWQSHIAELVRFGSIVQPRVGRGRCFAEDIRAGHFFALVFVRGRRIVSGPAN